MAERPQDFASDRYTIDQLVRAQHHHAPTRLLDVTTNPLIALYFACEEPNATNGQVIVFSVPLTNVKFFQSDSVSVKSNLAHLSAEQREGLVRATFTVLRDMGVATTAGWWGRMSADKSKVETFRRRLNEKEEIIEYVQVIRAEKPHFLERIHPLDLFNQEALFAKKSSARINAQSGAFFLFGLQEAISDTTMAGITQSVIEVDADFKLSISRSLSQFGIDEHSVYPEFERLGVSVARRFSASA